MKTAPPGLPPDVNAGTEALIREARRRQRRRHLLIGLAAVVLAVGAGVAVSQIGPGGHAPGHSGPHPGQYRGKSGLSSARSALPRFFADAVMTAEGNGPVEVRASATGRLVAEGATRIPVGVSGLAATGPGSFVIAGPGSGRCGTRLYRFRLSGRGRPGTLTPVGPELRGRVWSLAASAGGQVIGYAVSGCGKGARGYIGVLDTRTGRSREWGDVSVGGISPGNVALSGELSMSADGRLLAFSGWDVTGNWRLAGGGRFTSQVVRVLPADAPAGMVAQRSRVVLSRPVRAPELAAVSLSPAGTSFYLCTPVMSRAGRSTEIARYPTSSGRPRQIVATLRGTLPTPDCPMALDTTGRFLLVPYALSSAGHPLLKVARIDAAARRVSVLTIRLPASGGMDPYTGMIIAW